MFAYPPTEANIQFFAQALQAGGLVAMPTETVYGLAALALDEAACREIFRIKGRPLVDPLIVHAADMETVTTLADCPKGLALLAERFWPGPLTVILRKKPVVPDLVTAGRDTVAVRIPRHPVAQALLKATAAPLAAPSANPFGYVSPSRPEHVSESFGDTVPFILDGGPCEIGLESTIVDLTDPLQPCLLRPGAIDPVAVGETLGRPVSVKRESRELTEAAHAPGTFPSHYSPRTRLVLFAEGTPPAERAPKEAIVHLKAPAMDRRGPHTYWLSESGDPGEIARTLFALLRELDKKGYTCIQCELPREDRGGLSLALRDRMVRAASTKGPLPS